MKKVIAVIAFFAITLVSTNTVLAQKFDSRAAQVESKAFVKNNIEKLQLSVEQQKVIYNASMLKIRMTASARDNQAKEEINITFDEKLKAVLKPEQYKKYLAIK